MNWTFNILISMPKPYRFHQDENSLTGILTIKVSTKHSYQP